MRSRFLLLVPVVCLLLLPPSASARPAHKKALADYFGPFLAKKLNDCRACHVPDKTDPADDEDKPHNAFGARLKALRDERKKASQPADLATLLDTIAGEDSDGDGVSNLLEMLAGRFPGEANDKPSATELADAPKLQPAFEKFRRSYPWRPFETVKRPPVPTVKNVSWVRNPVDAFIAAGHEENELRPRPEAPKHVLMRRVYLDLTGLPPTREELETFLADTSPDAYEKVVDRLLASPRYGERWGRHWMDVWRYSDWAGWTGGNQIRDSQPHIWRWRDWIVESLNQDKTYNRMVLEMLAADELAPDDPNSLRATGYLVRNFKMLSREKWLQDTVDHTFQAFLGVTIGCARCHDHMFDEQVKQKDYYKVRAIFEPHQVRIDQVPGELDTKKDGLVRVYDANLEVPTYFLVRGDDRTPDKSKSIAPGIPAALGGTFPDVQPVTLPLSAYAPEKRDFVVKGLLAASAANVTKAREALTSARRNASTAAMYYLMDHPLSVTVSGAGVQRSFDALELAELEVAVTEARHTALAAVLRAEQFEDAARNETDEGKQAAIAAHVAQRKQTAHEARKAVLVAREALRLAAPPARAEASKKLDAAEKALVQAETAEQTPPTTTYTKRAVKTYLPTSSGRRLAFAHWVADRDNPLTARVAVNHMWLRHFNQALVPRVFDFGRNGPMPTQPALLDWLAAEFMERGWSMKQLHRLLLTSSTYRMASTPDADCVALDRDNKHYWRMPSRRMEAEAVRDCLFYVAGKLDLTMYGPDIDHAQGLTLPRRSLYFRHAQEKQMEFLKLFDCASPTECYQRGESVLPQQALALANSELSVKHSRLIARSLAAKVGPEADVFIRAAFTQVLSRPPSTEELAECAGFLKEQTQRFSETKDRSAATDESGPAAEPGLRARENLVHVLLNHHDFVTIR